MIYNVSIESKAALSDLKKLQAKMPAINFKAMQAVGVGMVGKVQQNRLTGQVLRVRSNQLRSRLASAVEGTGTTPTTYIGSNVLSDKGFNYPAHWELLATSVPPKPYIQPEIEAQNDYINRTYFKSIDKQINDLFR